MVFVSEKCCLWTNHRIYEFLRYCHHIDKDITLAVNSVHCGWSDSVWMLFSNKEIWVVLYLAVLVFLFRNLGWRRAMIGLLSIVLTIVCCDQLTFKTIVEHTARGGRVFQQDAENRPV